MEVGSTYRAMQAVSQGRLELTKKTLHAPALGKVRIRVEACGPLGFGHSGGPVSDVSGISEEQQRRAPSTKLGLCSTPACTACVLGLTDLFGIAAGNALGVASALES